MSACKLRKPYLTSRQFLGAIDENNLNARLVAPDGVNGRMFIVYQNYKNILYYNCSSYYAIAIGLLSDEIIK